MRKGQERQNGDKSERSVKENSSCCLDSNFCRSVIGRRGERICQYPS